MRWIVGVAVLFGVGCRVPARDNPNDPANRPAAELALYVGAPGGGVTGNRLTEFTLDASASSGPSERSLRFAWDVDGDGEFEVPDGSGVDCNGVARACLRTFIAIPAETLPGGIGTAQRTVRVRVSVAGDEERADIAEAVALVSNQGPSLPEEVDIFVPELTGGAVTLSPCDGDDACAVTDPDGEALEWEWNAVRPADVVLSSTTAAMPTFETPWEEQTLLFEATAWDAGRLASATTRVRVHVATQVWVTTSSPTRAYRLHPEFRQIARQEDVFDAPAPMGVLTTDYTSAFSGLASDGENLWLGRTGMDPADPFNFLVNEVQRRRPSVGYDFEEEAGYSFSLPGGHVPSIAAVGEEACAAVWVASSPAQHAFARLVPGQAPILTSSAGTEPRFVHRGPNDECWAVGGSTSSVDPENTQAAVFLLGADGSEIGTPDLDALREVHASARGSDGSLWIAGEDPVTCPDGTAFLHYLAGSPSAPAQSFCLDVAAVDALVPKDTGFYAHDAASGRIFLLTSSGSAVPTSAPITFLPGRGGDIPPAEPRMLYDAAEGELWVADSEGRLLRFQERAGDLEQEANLSGEFGDLVGVPRFAALALLESKGRVVTSAYGGSEDVIVVVASHLKRVEEVLVSGTFVTASAEPVRGLAWIADGTSTEASFRKIDARGREVVSTAFPGIANSVVSLADGGAIAVWSDAATPSVQGGVARLGPDASSIAELASADVAVEFAPGDVAARGSTACILGTDSFFDGILARADTNLSTGSVDSTSSPGVWYRPLDVATDGTSCWAAIEGIFDDMGCGCFLGKVVRFDGVVTDEIDMDGPSSIDVDPLTGSAFAVAFTSTGASAVFEIPSGTLVPEHRFGDLDLGVNLLAVQRRCAEPTCTGETELVLWVARGTSIQRTDVGGNVQETFTLPQIGNLLQLDVLP